MNGIRSGAAAALLAGPAVLAFASGGFFATARLWAAIAACLLAAVAAVVAAAAAPALAAGRIAIAGLAGLLAWTLLSRSWAPVVGVANADAAAADALSRRADRRDRAAARRRPRAGRSRRSRRGSWS